MMHDDPVRRSQRRVRLGRYVPSFDLRRIDLLDYRQSLFAEPPHDADRPQQPRRVVDQIDEGNRRGAGQNHRTGEEQVLNVFLGSYQRAQAKAQGQHEKRDDQPDGVVAQQGRGDDSRTELRAGDLDRNQQGAEGEDDERDRRGNQPLQQGLNRADFHFPSPGPFEPVIQVADKAYGYE
jgi:hypothetical protein